MVSLVHTGSGVSFLILIEVKEQKFAQVAYTNSTALNTSAFIPVFVGEERNAMILCPQRLKLLH